MDRAGRIERALRRAFAPTRLVVDDESAQHRGHPGAAAGGGHFRVLIVSEAFGSQSRVARHRAVYAALGSAMRSDVHALALQALTPEEWDRQQRSGATS